MISGFTKFNESLTNIDKLKTDVDSTFAYISDENKVSTYIRDNEVYVDIISILPNNIIYDNIEEYVNKHEIWHETLLDINVAIQQLTIKGSVGFKLNINTVGNVRIIFYIINDKLYKSSNLYIIISRNNLIKLINDKKISDITKVYCDNNEFKIYFHEHISVDHQKEIARKIKEIFNKNGIVDKYINSFWSEGIEINTWPYDVDHLSIRIFKVRENNKRIYKSIKIQNSV
jgi:hypothetical protein